MKKLTGFIRFSAALAILPFQASLMAQTHVDPPPLETIGPSTPIQVVPPTNTWWGTRGLSQTGSAEALGEGRLIFGFHGSGYEQQREFTGTPNLNARIFTGTGSASWGVSPFVDLFGFLSGFGSMDYTSQQGSGLGSVGGGLQGTFPFAPYAPIRMAAQGAVLQGLSDNPVNDNRADGYHYFETRTDLDFMGKLIQSLTFGDERSAFKIHFNEGVVTSMESGRDPLMLLASGIQFNNRYAAVGLEANSRTMLNDIQFDTDPLWITPSLQFRSAYNVNLSVGGDIAMSRDRGGPEDQRALEPFRLFGGLAFSFDTQADERWEAKERARMRLLEKQRLGAQNLALSQSLDEAKQDSLAMARAKADAEAEAQAAAVKASQDSMAMANKAREDSLALLSSQTELDAEKAKRSELEKQLLSTGSLLLDAVYFETARAEISINSEPYLKMIGQMLTKYPKLQIEVAGHTDNVGSDAYNQGLSQQRAEAVRSYLIRVEPGLNGLLTARGYGESKPKADNVTAEGRQQNRRTQLEVLNRESLREYNAGI